MSHVLVVDDDAATLETFALGLRHFGHGVDVADCGLTALSSLDRTTPDAVLLDLNLPDIDGYAFLRQMRDRGITVPTAVMTGFYLDFDPAEARALGAVTY